LVQQVVFQTRTRPAAAFPQGYAKKQSRAGLTAHNGVQVLHVPVNTNYVARFMPSFDGRKERIGILK